MRKYFKIKILLLILALPGLFLSLRADDSRNNPVRATYCDGSEVLLYPYSVVTKNESEPFNDYESKVTSIENGLRYAFEDWNDNDYNDLIIDLWVSGNGTGSPVAHIKYISKDADANHRLHLVYGDTDIFVFDADETKPGTVFDIPLPTVECNDFSINVTPEKNSIYPGESTYYTVSVQSEGEFSEPVKLSLNGLPEGATFEFDENPIKPAGETKLRVNTSESVLPGSYTLTIEGESGEISHSDTIILEIRECKDFQVSIEAEPKEGSVPLNVSFYAKVDGEDGNYTYSWDFGDGGTSVEKNPKYTYTSPGSYTVTLIVKNQCGIKKKADVTVNVYGFEGTIIKRFLKTEASPTEEVFMEIKVNNNTNYDFNYVKIWDEISSYLIYEGDNAPVKPEIKGRKLIWNLPKIGKRESISFRVKLSVRKDAPETKIVNVAYLNHKTLNKPIMSNRAYLNIEAPELKIEMKVDKNSAKPAESLLYTIRVENLSDVDIEGLKIEDEIPDALEFLSQYSGFGFKRNGSKLIWEGILKKNSTKSFTVKTKIKNTTLSGTIIRNRVYGIADILKDKVYSNVVTTKIDTTPISISKIILRKKAEIPQAEVGKIIRFAITIMNKSSSPLINSQLDDYLPQGFVYVKGTAIYNGSKFTAPQGKRHLHWSLPIINPGENAILRYQVIIGSDAKRGKNINRALLRAIDNSGQNINLESDAFVNVSSTSFIFYSGIEGFVYLDRNKNRVFDASDTPLENIEVRLSDGEKTYTDITGHFVFKGLYPGEYAIGINTAVLPDNFSLNSPSPLPVVLSDGLTSYIEFDLSLKKEEKVEKSSIDGFAFFDRNSNRNFDEGEPIPKQFRVILDSKLITKGKKGKFKFSHIKPGKHILEIKHGIKSEKIDIKLKEGLNEIKIPIKFSGIRVTIRGAK